MTIHKLGPHTNVTCAIEKGMEVRISKEWGYKLGGKIVYVLDVVFRPNVSGSFLMNITGYDDQISVNWAEEIIPKQTKLEL